MKIASIFFFTIINIILLDVLWLTLLFKRFYSAYLSEILAQSANWWAAGCFYLVYATGLVFFIILPALAENTSLAKTFLIGALFGIVAYGTYDFTNQATLKDWPWIVTIIDISWGAILTGLTSVSSAFIVRYLTKIECFNF